MTLAQATAHNADQPFSQILHIFLQLYDMCELRENDMYKLFKICTAARELRKNIHITFKKTKQLIENENENKDKNETFINEILTGYLKLKCTLCDPNQTPLNHIFIHDPKKFGEFCYKYNKLLVVCNRRYIFYIDKIISRYIYSDEKQYQETLNYIKYIKQIYPNCLFYLNLSRIKQMAQLDLLGILSIDGVNLSRTGITNESFENITLPLYTDITHCDKITKIDPTSFASVKTLKVSLDNIQPYDIPSHIQELHILNRCSIKMNLYENQFLYLIKLCIYNMEVDTWTWIIPNLRKLCLKSCAFTSYENIANFLLLEELIIKDDIFDDTQIKHISHLPKLKTLSLSNCTYLKNFSFILQMKLHTLDVSYCKITNDSLQYFIGITDLNLSHTAITDLSMLNITVKLMTLNISHCALENISFLYRQEFSELNIAHSSVKESDLVGCKIKKNGY
jgi:hypothetical protein